MRPGCLSLICLILFIASECSWSGVKKRLCKLSSGVMRGIAFSCHKTATRDSVKIFAPGMIYGGAAHLTPAAIGFEVPGLNIEPGLEIALDVAVCDDDGKGRKSLLIWSGVNNEYWLSPVTKLMTVRD